MSSTDDVYGLISDIFGLLGRYSLRTLKEARDHVRHSFQGADRDALLRILGALEGQIRWRNERVHAAVEVPPNETPPNGSSDTAELREITAILQDLEFLKSKADVIRVVGQLLGEELKASAKDSRDAVVRKALAAFAALSPSKRTAAFKTLQRRFLKDRGSSLEAWTEIIQK